MRMICQKMNIHKERQLNLLKNAHFGFCRNQLAKIYKKQDLPKFICQKMQKGAFFFKIVE